MALEKGMKKSKGPDDADVKKGSSVSDSQSSKLDCS